MWRALLILILSIGILGGGFYYFASNEGWFDKDPSTITEDNSDKAAALVANNETVTPVENPWTEYKYQQNGVLFSTKYPAENWKTVEQLNGSELTIIFTNNDSCQVMYLFNIRQGQYKSELSNNKNSEGCAEVLRKIVSIATIPQFGVSMDADAESSTTSPVSTTDGGVTTTSTNNPSTTNDEKTTDVVVGTEDKETDDKTDTTTTTSEPKTPAVISSGVSDQEINEMTAVERYNSAKTFVNNWLLEYAKRRWATIESQLSSKAKTALGGKTLSSVATPFYYYELLTVLKEVSLTQYQVNVKLTTKEETPIGSGDGIYTLNMVWEYGEWKMDNYLFE
jgi:hypothetical protein